MTDKALKHLCMLIVCIMAVISITSCSSDDNPSEEVIPQLKQKLIGGIWLAGKIDEGNLVTISFLEENKAVFNVIFGSKLYYKQEKCDYEVKGNTIFTGKYQIKVKSFSDKSMDVEITNFPEDGQAYSATYIRRNPSMADNLEYTEWMVKKCVPWIEANKDEVTLPANLTINNKRTINPKDLPNTFKQLMNNNYFIHFVDDEIMAQVLSLGNMIQMRRFSYTLDGYKMCRSVMNGDYETKVNQTVFKTEEGNLFFIFDKEGVVEYMIDFYMMQARYQKYEITSNEWDAFAKELAESLDKAAVFLILEEDEDSKSD